MTRRCPTPLLPRCSPSPVALTISFTKTSQCQQAAAVFMERAVSPPGSLGRSGMSTGAPVYTAVTCKVPSSWSAKTPPPRFRCHSSLQMGWELHLSASPSHLATVPHPPPPSKWPALPRRPTGVLIKDGEVLGLVSVSRPLTSLPRCRGLQDHPLHLPRRALGFTEE